MKKTVIDTKSEIREQILNSIELQSKNQKPFTIDVGMKFSEIIEELSTFFAVEGFKMYRCSKNKLVFIPE